MAGLQAVKRRINSVESTQKITNAMKLVASSKFRKAKEVYETRKEFMHELTVSNDFKDMLSQLAKEYDYKLFDQQEDKKTLYILITSDMGLCGGYNINASKLAVKNIKENDHVLTIGRKGYQFLKSKGIQADTHYDDVSSSYKLGHFYGIATQAFDLISSGQVNAVSVVYTHFRNSVSFEPRIYEVFPIHNSSNEEHTRFECLNELDEAHIEILAVEYLAGVIYSSAIESKMCEYASSRTAMENATDNAQEIKENLLLQYNQKRQANITQEISEIVAGADAL